MPLNTLLLYITWVDYHSGTVPESDMLIYRGPRTCALQYFGFRLLNAPNIMDHCCCCSGVGY